MRATVIALLLLALAASPASAAVPVATAGPGTTTTPDGATFAGAANTGGVAGTAHFEYGPTAAYGNRTSDQPLAAVAGNQPVKAVVSGLGAAPTHYRLVVTTTGGSGASADQVAYRAPALTLQPVTGITATTATVTGSVALRGAPSAQAQFVVGSVTTPLQAVTADGTVTARLSGLQPSTAYGVKLRVTRGTEVFETPEATFTTVKATTPPGDERPAIRPSVALRVPEGRTRGTLLLRRRPLAVQARCGDAPCRFSASGVVRAGRRVLGRLSGPRPPLRLGKGERGTIFLATTKALRKRVRASLRAHPKRRVVLTLKATFRDAAGTRFTRRLRIRVRLP